MHLRPTLTFQASLLIALLTMTVRHGSAQGPVFTTLYEFKGGADGSMAAARSPE